MATSTYNVEHVPSEKKFQIVFSDNSRALLEYAQEAPGIYEFYHTETPVSQRGKGIAAIVSKAAMEWIKSNNYKAHFTCSYLRNDFLPKNPEWKDWVVDESKL